jgi:hypothetical protein
MPLLLFAVYIPTHLLELQSFFYLEFVWGCAPSPLSGGACHTLATIGYLPLSKHTGGSGTTPTSPAGLFIYSSCEGVPLPHSPELRASSLFATCLFFFFSAACLLFSLCFSFFPGQGSVCPGGYADLSQGCLWECRVLLIYSPGGLCLLSRIGADVWQHGSPPGFSI